MTKYHYKDQTYHSFWELNQATPDLVFSEQTPLELLAKLGITVEEIPDPEPTPEENAPAAMPEAPAAEPEKAEDTATESETAEESTAEANEPAGETAPAEESGTMEILYNVTGPRRKELAAAVGSFIGAEPKYMKAPTYAFVVEDYTIGRDGTLTGRENKALVEALAAQGFTAA